jgi:outer membrane protein assembly factor BamB
MRNSALLTMTILFGGLLFPPEPLTAAPPGVEWIESYGGDDFDHGFDAANRSGGGFLLAGQTKSFGAGGLDVYLVAVDDDGRFLWERTHGGPANDVCQAIVPTADGGFALAGYTGIPPHDYDVQLIKIDASGELSWQRTYPGDGDERGVDLIQTADGGFLIASETDLQLFRTDASGSLIWQRTLGGPNDGTRSLAQTADGGFLIAGHRKTGSVFVEFDALVARLNSGGGVQWMKEFDEGFDEMAFSVLETANGDVAFCGNLGGSTALWRLNGSGHPLWRSQFLGGYATDLVQTDDGGLLFAGNVSAAVYLVKTESDGALHWSAQHGGPLRPTTHSLLRTDDGGYLVAGSAVEDDGYGFDMFALRLAGDPGNATGVDDRLPSQAGGFLLSNHPNPFNPSTTISFVTREAGPVDLGVFDAAGRRVRTLARGLHLEAGTHEFIWNGADQSGSPLASGVYFARVESGLAGESRRITIMK